MRFGIFYQHSLPRPWEPGDERRLLEDALEQIEIADDVGIDFVWEAEHHFLEEHSHSSAPEVFLAAVSQLTSRIRLGHGTVQLAHPVNHPARVAERIGMLDLLSDGRVDFGTGQAASATERGGFLVPRTAGRRQWEDALAAITSMFVEEPFAGWDSEWLRMPPRNVVPKPLQKPHPPLWLACHSREAVRLAARRGLGALSFRFADPDEVAGWAADYDRIVRSEECVPAGFAVNPSLAVLTPMMCHRDEAVAVRRGLEGAMFLGYSRAHYADPAPHEPGRTSLWEAFRAGLERRSPSAGGGVRGAIGTPDQIRDVLRRYETAGVDQVSFVVQAGRNRHEHVCESLELFGEEILPEFAERAATREARRREELLPSIRRALARRPPARRGARYRVDERVELARALRPSPLFAPWQWVAAAIEDAAARLRRGVRDLVRELVRLGDDRWLDWLVGPIAQRAILTAMTFAYDPAGADGFRGDIVWEFHPATNGNGNGANGAQRWTIRVDGERAVLRSGDSREARMRLSLGTADFVRLVSGDLGPATSVLDGRIRVQGDVSSAVRMAEMFGSGG